MSRRERGQTLIETIVAIFVLTTGLSAGLALAIFAFSASSDISERIIATGLAREGVEGVRRLRDSNWLWGKQNGKLLACPDLGAAEVCYVNWLGPAPYDIHGAADPGTPYRLSFNPAAAGNKLTLDQGSIYRLYAQLGGGLSHTVNSQPTNLFRKIFVIYLCQSGSINGYCPNGGYTNSSPLVLVRSVVWWHGKKCPVITDYNSPSDTTCKIVTEENLTNWKDY